tara:strand:+ start:1664 stop:2065 length:402 start_codon:yes stop_codon:yes gene_type:complete
MKINKKHNIKISSNKSFGIVFFIFFFIVAMWPILNNENPRFLLLLISLVFLILGLINSSLLSPLNKIWFKFGIFLGNFISPIVMGIIFFLVVTPIGLIMRLLGKNLLRLNKEKNTNTYWLKKDEYKSSMKNQF